jgi:hypothetical protein
MRAPFRVRDLGNRTSTASLRCWALSQGVFFLFLFFFCVSLVENVSLLLDLASLCAVAYRA